MELGGNCAVYPWLNVDAIKMQLKDPKCLVFGSRAMMDGNMGVIDGKYVDHTNPHRV